MLFNLFVRELPNEISAQSIQFADDITISSHSTDPKQIISDLKDSFDQTKQFCDSHDLIINANKTQLIIFQAPGKRVPSDLEIVLDGHAIKPCISVKLLGVTLDRQLTFGNNIDEVVRKCHGLIGVLARAAPFLCRKLLRLAYTALIRSHLEYCSAIIASASPTQLEKLDTIQRISARVICRVPRDAHSAPLLHALQLETLESRRNKHIVSVVKSILSGDCHPALTDWFTSHPDGHIDSAINPPRISYGKRRFRAHAKLVCNNDLSPE